MTSTESKNIPASVRQRLYDLSKSNEEDFNLLLKRFSSERFLYRLGLSKYRENFFLKGAALFNLWFDFPHRPTRDLDLLCFGSNEIRSIVKIVAEICAIEYADGLVFDQSSFKSDEIKEGDEYQGVRVTFLAYLGNARINMQIDVGFGDAVNPDAEEVTFPTLLDHSPPNVKAYQKETVIAEKFEAMVKLGIANSRMKDFWDVRVLINEFEFDGNILQKAIRATFERRGTDFPAELPLALTEEFVQEKQTQWRAFISKNDLKNFADLDDVIDTLKGFFSPILESIRKNETFELKWWAMIWK